MVVASGGPSPPGQGGPHPLVHHACGLKRGKPRGTPEPPRPKDKDPNNIRSLRRENEAAEILANAGFDVEQRPSVPGDKRPDYRIEGRVFDHLAPSTANERNILTRIRAKVDEGQADRIVLDLGDTRASPVEIQRQLREYPAPGLKEIITIAHGHRIEHLFPEREQHEP